MTMKAAGPVPEREIAAPPPQHRRTSIRAGSESRAPRSDCGKDQCHDLRVDQGEVSVDQQPRSVFDGSLIGCGRSGRIEIGAWIKEGSISKMLRPNRHVFIGG